MVPSCDLINGAMKCQEGVRVPRDRNVTELASRKTGIQQQRSAKQKGVVCSAADGSSSGSSSSSTSESS